MQQGDFAERGLEFTRGEQSMRSGLDLGRNGEQGGLWVRVLIGLRIDGKNNKGRRREGGRSPKKSFDSMGLW